MPIEKDVVYLTIPHEVLYHPALDPTGKMLLALVAFRDRPGEPCKDSNADLGAILGVSERTIRRSLAELRDLGYIYTDDFDGRERTLRIVPEYYDLLRGGMGNNRPARLAGQVGKLAGQADKRAGQTGQNGRPMNKVKESERNIKKERTAEAHTNAPEPEPPTPEEWSHAIQALRSRSVPLKDPERAGQREIVLAEVLKLRQDTQG